MVVSMTLDTASAQDPTANSSKISTNGSDPVLSIGDLAERTGLSAATLRMWESRHGFPVPHRLASGHRRYRETDVAAVDHVVRRRDAGTRLETAIAEALAHAEPTAPSVFAELRSRHPYLETHRLQKSTLLALSWAIEDQFCAKAQRGRLFGSFQHEQYYRHARPRWQELSKLARSTMVFYEPQEGGAAADQSAPHPGGPIVVPLSAEDPMRREWMVVCDSADLPVALTAWEVPGQSGVRDSDRVFESMWTVEPVAVRDAARVSARVAQEHGVVEAAPLLYQLSDEPAGGVADLRSVTTLFNRVVAYVDRFGR